MSAGLLIRWPSTIMDELDIREITKFTDCVTDKVFYFPNALSSRSATNLTFILYINFDN